MVNYSIDEGILLTKNNPKFIDPDRCSGALGVAAFVVSSVTMVISGWPSFMLGMVLATIAGGAAALLYRGISARANRRRQSERAETKVDDREIERAKQLAEAKASGALDRFGKTKT